MSVRAKFKCDSIEKTKQGDDEMATVRLSAVYGNADPNHENSRFWKWTPSGSLMLGTINASAASQFEEGKEYYLDISPAS